MHTDLCDQFGIDVPIFAFSHCRDVVAAVTKAAGSNGRSEAVGDLLRGHAREVERFMDIIEELKGEEAPSLAAVSVTTRELAALADRLS